MTFRSPAQRKAAFAHMASLHVGEMLYNGFPMKEWNSMTAGSMKDILRSFKTEPSYRAEVQMKRSGGQDLFEHLRLKRK